MGDYERARYVPSMLRIAALYDGALHDRKRAATSTTGSTRTCAHSTMRDDALWREAVLYQDGDTGAVRAPGDPRTQFPGQPLRPVPPAECPGVRRAVPERRPEGAGRTSATDARGAAERAGERSERSERSERPGGGPEPVGQPFSLLLPLLPRLRPSSSVGVFVLEVLFLEVGAFGFISATSSSQIRRRTGAAEQGRRPRHQLVSMGSSSSSASSPTTRREDRSSKKSPLSRRRSISSTCSSEKASRMSSACPSSPSSIASADSRIVRTGSFVGDLHRWSYPVCEPPSACNIPCASGQSLRPTDRVSFRDMRTALVAMLASTLLVLPDTGRCERRRRDEDSGKPAWRPDRSAALRGRVPRVRRGPRRRGGRVRQPHLRRLVDNCIFGSGGDLRHARVGWRPSEELYIGGAYGISDEIESALSPGDPAAAAREAGAGPGGHTGWPLHSRGRRRLRLQNDGGVWTPGGLRCRSAAGSRSISAAPCSWCRSPYRPMYFHSWVVAQTNDLQGGIAHFVGIDVAVEARDRLGDHRARFSITRYQPLHVPRHECRGTKKIGKARLPAARSSARAGSLGSPSPLGRQASPAGRAFSAALRRAPAFLTGDKLFENHAR